MSIITRFKLFSKALIVRFKGRPRALQRAIKRADKLCKLNGKRYRVYFVEGKYQALSRQQIQRKKHSGEWGRHVNVTRLEPLCFYDTLTGAGKMI